jgi:membrane-bound metal-dependent hydrolase YbcI (DUF457 family)
MDGWSAMSWAAHELENFYFLKHIGRRVSYLGLLLGALAPDFLTKLYTYGLNIGGIHLEAENPAQFHRGWPGMGFTTSLTAGLIFASFIYLISKRNKAWFFGVLVGYWAHTITDSFDSVGVMMFWPFYNGNIRLGVWAYGAGEGKYGDTIAYYSSLGFVVDVTWLLIVVLFAWRVLSSEYFRTVVRPADPAWGWFERKFALPERALLAFYRAFFFYGACRIICWSLWVHLVKGAPWDLSWGGPRWVAPFEPW